MPLKCLKCLCLSVRPTIHLSVTAKVVKNMRGILLMLNGHGPWLQILSNCFSCFQIWIMWIGGDAFLRVVPLHLKLSFCDYGCRYHHCPWSIAWRLKDVGHFLLTSCLYPQYESDQGLSLKQKMAWYHFSRFLNHANRPNESYFSKLAPLPQGVTEKS